ncbi:hypothetical protein [Azospirillum thermophilum]|uniref:Uncharacterized protein n=1 Tax=Azospirillum thermophilum TaxID=2202148 RepID=A0A2S2CMM1_9PROT|nr:hypothetical protein [Azospirillum thermophilum]AWK85620.1 hypothetical protein DEW08_05090 [Azospirillum thermophilum]
MADSIVRRPEMRPEFQVRTAAGVERTGNATDNRKQRNPRQDRRNQQPPNPARRRVYDLLFDEVDRIDDLQPQQRARIKDNLRAQLTARKPPDEATAPPPAEQDEGALADALLRNPQSVPVDHDHIVGLAAPTHGELPPDLAAENAQLAQQLRDCLSRHTERARRVAVYLHLLLSIDGAFRPHTILDV